jgi:hypothetical protein
MVWLWSEHLKQFVGISLCECVIRLNSPTYVCGQEADGHAYDEDGPEYMEKLQHKHQAVEEVVAKEGLVDGHWVDPRAVYDPLG